MPVYQVCKLLAYSDIIQHERANEGERASARACFYVVRGGVNSDLEMHKRTNYTGHQVVNA